MLKSFTYNLGWNFFVIFIIFHKFLLFRTYLKARDFAIMSTLPLNSIYLVCQLMDSL